MASKDAFKTAKKELDRQKKLMKKSAKGKAKTEKARAERAG